jgi:dipeptidyl aminopeptidase/acylaminoacyl peptidase
LLHGRDDKVVTARQSDELAERVRAAGTPVEHHVYDGEGHGWRRAATVVDELARIDTFLARWLP